MKLRNITTVGLIMLSAFSGGAFTTWILSDQPAYAQNRSIGQAVWEYKRTTHAVYTDNDTQFQRELSQQASEGWELIQVNEGARYSNHIVTYWKRIKTSPSY